MVATTAERSDISSFIADAAADTRSHALPYDEFRACGVAWAASRSSAASRPTVVRMTQRPLIKSVALWAVAGRLASSAGTTRGPLVRCFLIAPRQTVSHFLKPLGSVLPTSVVFVFTSYSRNICSEKSENSHRCVVVVLLFDKRHCSWQLSELGQINANWTTAMIKRFIYLFIYLFISHKNQYIQREYKMNALNSMSQYRIKQQ